MKRITLLAMFLSLLLLAACSDKYWILEKERASESTTLSSYVNNLQNSKPGFKGYTIFTIAEGKKMVVISSGTSSKTIDLSDVEFSKNETRITVVEKANESEDINPYLLIGLNKIKGELIVTNEEGEVYTDNM